VLANKESGGGGHTSARLAVYGYTELWNLGHGSTGKTTRIGFCINSSAVPGGVSVINIAR